MITLRLRGNSIYMNYYYNGNSNPLRISTKIKIDPVNWDKHKQKAKSSSLKYKGKSINKELTSHQNALYSAIQYYEQNAGFSEKNLKAKYFEFLYPGSIPVSKQKKNSFLDYYKCKLKFMFESDMDISSEYRTTYNHLIEFSSGVDYSFNDIDMKFYVEYNQYLLSKNLSKNTISKHWKHIKALMQESYLEKKHKNTDYLNFKRFREEADTIYLTEDELERIYSLKLKGTEEVVRDYFIIGCYTGLRYSDWDRVELSKAKDKIITIRTSKTGELSTIPLHPKVLKILMKYKSNKMPKKISNQKMNNVIKTIGLKAKIGDLIENRITKGGKVVKTTKPKYMYMSTHTARRSFATNLILQGVSPHLIMKMTGHKSLSSFEKYVRFDDLQATIELKNIVFFN